MKKRAIADLLNVEEVAPAVGEAIAPGMPVSHQEPVDLVWFEEWGWGRERTRRIAFAECPACGTVYWAAMPPV